MTARNGTTGARAAVYRGAAVLVGAEMAARNGILGARAAVYRRAAVLVGACNSDLKACCAEGAERICFKNSKKNGDQLAY